MSTYLYLQCVDHDPPLRSDDEVGQHTYDLPRVFADLDHRAEVIKWHDGWLANPTRQSGNWDSDIYFRRHAARFLRQHPECAIEVWDEYGVQRKREDAA